MQDDAGAPEGPGRRDAGERHGGAGGALDRFLHSGEKPYPALREVAVGAGIVLVVLGLLWGLTGQPIGRSPIVVVESGSMMHCSNGVGVPLGRDCDSSNFGRLGTIDPGDLILVKDIDGPGDVDTHAGGGRDHYGRSGDVIVYRPDGDHGRTPVIHRALFWLQVNSDDTFTVAELGLDHVKDLDTPEIRELGLAAGYDDSVLRESRLDSLCGPVGPSRSGFITRGDNNNQADQALHSSISTCPAKTDWVLGKARGEVPWLGLIKLLYSDLLHGTPNYHNAAGDVKLLLWLTLAVVIGGPYAYEKIKHRRQANRPPPPT